MRTIESDDNDDTNGTHSRRNGKQEWEKLYRAAVLESEQSILPQRIKAASDAISDRVASLARRADSHGKEQDALARALHMLSLLQRKPGIE
jgi:hypothetical protein